MAVTFTPDKSGDSSTIIALAGGLYLLFGTLSFSGSYVTGGDSLNLSAFMPKSGTVRQCVPQAAKLPVGLEYDLVNKKLKVNWINAAAASEAAGAVEHAAAAYEAIFTAAPVPVSFLLK